MDKKSNQLHKNKIKFNFTWPVLKGILGIMGWWWGRGRRRKVNCWKRSPLLRQFQVFLRGFSCFLLAPLNTVDDSDLGSFTKNLSTTTMRYHFTPVRMAIINKSTNYQCWRGCGEKGILVHCWWECRLVQPLWKTVWNFLRKLKMEQPFDPVIPLLGL